MTLPSPPGGAGLGWRPEIATALLREPGAADFVEVVAETCFAQPRARREARAIAELWPVVLHGVKLSLASADGIDVGRARRLGALARELAAPAVSEHVALTRGGATEIGHLTAVPFTRQTVRTVARNVAALRRSLPDVPLYLENIAWTFRWPEDEMGEGDFHAEIAEATGCPLLLDLANLAANAVNAHVAPAALLETYPLERVGMVHVAGGVVEDGFLVDTHAHSVSEEVFALLETLLAVTGPIPVILERDAGFPPFGELVAELSRARVLLRNAPRTRNPLRPQFASNEIQESSGAVLSRQKALADLLTRPDLPAGGDLLGISRAALERTRRILLHKRVDEAAPLLPHLGASTAPLHETAVGALATIPRAARFAGILDAVAIARAALGNHQLAAAARLDLLELRARFTSRGRPRLLPAVGATRLPGRGRAWALKGPGRHASTIVYGAH